MISIAAAIGLIIFGGVFLRSTYRRIETRLLLMDDAIETRGILTEKTVTSARDVIFPITLYTVRYTFTNTDGFTRNGQQDLTAAEYHSLPPTGSPVTIFFKSSDSAYSAVSRMPGFPGAAGWRAAVGITCLAAAAFCVGTGGYSLAKKNLTLADPESRIQGD